MYNSIQIFSFFGVSDLKDKHVYNPSCNNNSLKYGVCNLKKEIKYFSLTLHNSFTAKSKQPAFEIKAFYISKTKHTIEK